MIKRSKREVVELFLERQAVDKYYSPIELADELGYKSSSRIRRALRHYNISYVRNDSNKALHKSFDLEVLNGNLLGDGFVYYSTKISNWPVFSVEYKHREYCEYIRNHNPFLKGKDIKRRERFDERYKLGTIEIYKCTSLASSVLKDLHTKWYINGIKSVPKDISLTPQTLLIWYLDDGFRNSSGGVNLATDGFSLEDNELLKTKLEKLGLKVTFHIASSRKNVRLYIPKKSAEDFLHLIGPCPVECYQHKWM
jgi:hypothetical protein